MVKRGVADVDGVPVAYRVHGHGYPIVMVNGTAALDAHWGTVVGALAKQRAVITLDYAGSGETPLGVDALTLDGLARQVRGVARAEGAERFDLLGHSLGTAIAVTLAAQTPDRVGSLLLVAGFPLGAEPRLALQFRLWLDLIRTNRDAFLKVLLLTGLTPAFISRIGTEAIDQMIGSYMPLANWDGVTRQVELDLAVDVRAQAQSLNRPTLVIGGAHDQIITQARELANLIPCASYRQVDGGHLMFLETPAELVALATDFLDVHAT